jgi:hypothetical protein
VPDVFKTSGGKIVDNEHLIAAREISVSQVRSDKTRAASDQNSQLGTFRSFQLPPGVSLTR